MIFDSQSFLLLVLSLLIFERHSYLVSAFFSEENEKVSTEDDSDEPDLSGVTCGSVIKLRNPSTEVRLHSHQVTYGSGSGQQSVTGFPAIDDPNSYWIVKGAHGAEPCRTGTKIKRGDIIRLQHLNTGRNLHSHLQKSPLTNQQEVSAYGEEGNGDTGDNWKVIPKLGTSDTWNRGEIVRLNHVDTGKFLSTNKNKYGNPIPNQQEVCCISQSGPETDWEAQEGFYFPALT